MRVGFFLFVSSCVVKSRKLEISKRKIQCWTNAKFVWYFQWHKRGAVFEETFHPSCGDGGHHQVWKPLFVRSLQACNVFLLQVAFCLFVVFYCWPPYIICRLKIMKERTQVKEKNLVINILEISEVGFTEMKINVCSSEAAVALWCILYQLMPLCWLNCKVKDWICVGDGLVLSPCSVCLGIRWISKLWTLVATVIVVKLFRAGLLTPGVTWTTAWHYGGSWMGWV